MKIYTRTGDQGETGLPGGARVAKDADRLETVGTIDELNATLGMVRAELLPEDIDRLIERIQHELFAIMAELAAAGADVPGARTMGATDVRALEEAIDRYEAALEPLREFILPAGTRPAAGLQLARTVCRRAERRLITLARDQRSNVAGSLTAYLNRLSDLLFVLARAVNARAGHGDAPWRKGS